MKPLLAIVSVLAACIAAAADYSTTEWGMPDTGIAPGFYGVEAAAKMGERHGGSRLSWSSYYLSVPFLDPRKTHVGKWHVNANLDCSATILGLDGDLDLRRNELYSAGLPVSAIRSTGKSRLILTLAPSVSSDFTGGAHYFDLVGSVLFTFKVNDKFNFTIGTAAAPRFIAYGVLPVYGFEWRMTPEWELRLQRYKLSALYSATERLQVGPFAGVRGGAWMIDTPDGDRIFRIRSLVAGLTAEYDFHSGDQPKRILYASVGSTLATSAGYCKRSFSKENIEGRHYKPGLYAAFGADFRF